MRQSVFKMLITFHYLQRERAMESFTKCPLFLLRHFDNEIDLTPLSRRLGQQVFSVPCINTPKGALEPDRCSFKGAYLCSIWKRAMLFGFHFDSQMWPLVPFCPVMEYRIPLKSELLFTSPPLYFSCFWIIE